MSDQENPANAPEQSPSTPEPDLPEMEPYSQDIFIEEDKALHSDSEER